MHFIFFCQFNLSTGVKKITQLNQIQKPLIKSIHSNFPIDYENFNKKKTFSFSIIIIVAVAAVAVVVLRPQYKRSTHSCVVGVDLQRNRHLSFGVCLFGSFLNEMKIRTIIFGKLLNRIMDLHKKIK